MAAGPSAGSRGTDRFRWKGFEGVPERGLRSSASLCASCSVSDSRKRSKCIFPG